MWSSSAQWIVLFSSLFLHILSVLFTVTVSHATVTSKNFSFRSSTDRQIPLLSPSRTTAGDFAVLVHELQVVESLNIYLQQPTGRLFQFRPLQIVHTEDAVSFLWGHPQIPEDVPGRHAIQQKTPLYSEKNLVAAERIARLASDALNFRKTSSYHRDKKDEILSGLMGAECSVSDIHGADLDLLQVKSDQELSDPGLSFESSYRYNAYDDDGYRQRAYAGLSWDVLHSGLMENRSQARIYGYEKEISEIRQTGNQLLYQERCRDMLLIKFFNILKLDLLRQRQQLLDSYYYLMKKGYLQGIVLLDDLMKIEYEVKKNNATLMNYETQLPLSGEEMFPFNANQFPPLLLLDINAIVKHIETDPQFNTIAGLEKAILNEKYDALYATRLRLFSQLGAVEDNNAYEYGRGRMGVQLTIPLFNDRSVERDYAMIKSRQTLRREQTKMLLEARRLYNAYGEKINDAIGMEYKERIVAERLRRSLLLWQQNRYGNGVYDIAGYLIELFDVRFEALAVQEGLYRRLLHMMSLTGIGFDKQFIRYADFGSDSLRGRLGDRAVYIWSETFNNMDHGQLLDVVLAKSISRVLLSFSSKTNPDTLRKFIDAASDRGVVVELMASANKWIFPDHQQQLDAFLSKAFALTSAVHLDIEPYTLPGYKTNQQKYVDAYVQMVKKVSRYRQPGQTVSVSLPIHFAKKVIDRLDGDIDRLYIMAYNMTDPKKVAEKLRPLLLRSTAEIVLALRPSDFKDELQMESFDEVFYAATGVKAFAFHNFKTFLQLIGL